MSLVWNGVNYWNTNNKVSETQFTRPRCHPNIQSSTMLFINVTYQPASLLAAPLGSSWWASDEQSGEWRTAER